MSHFTSPEEFLEKRAGLGSGLTFGLKAKPLEAKVQSELPKFVEWWRGLSRVGKAGVGLGVAGILGAGAMGLWGAAEGHRPSDTISYRINRGMFGLLDRIRADEQVGEAFAKELGSNSAKSLMGLTKDILSKGYDSMKDTLALSPVRKKIFNVLKKEDDIIGVADNKTLMEAYHTMANIAPNLSTDKNAVKSVLRMAATSGGGLDYNTIKGLADAEASILKTKSLSNSWGASK